MDDELKARRQRRHVVGYASLAVLVVVSGAAAAEIFDGAGSAVNVSAGAKSPPSEPPTTMRHEDGITCPTDNSLVWIDSEEHFASVDALVDANSHEPFTFDADKRLLSYARVDGSTYAVLEPLEHGSVYGVSIRHCQGEQPGLATGVAPLRQQVTLEIGHCWIDPITFDGQKWAVASEQQYGWGEGPHPGLTGQGTALRTSPTQVDYVDHGFNALTFYPADDPRTTLPGGGICD